jgi:formylglycine-generating enzyme
MPKGFQFVASACVCGAVRLAVGCPLGTIEGLTGGQAPVDASEDRLDTGRADGACPGDAGPIPVRVTVGEGSFCVDSTEVTRAEYVAFLKAAGPPREPDPLCEYKNGSDAGYEPSSSSNCEKFWPPSVEEESLPMGCIDWCDARAYCTWAGKRLCGAIGGGPASFDAPDASTDEWYLACSKGGTRIYPYGNDFEAEACNVAQKSPDGGYTTSEPQAPVMANGQCVGGFKGLYDMAGNVEEWEDACDDAGLCEAGAGPRCNHCLTRGGSSFDYGSPTVTRCDLPSAFQTYTRDGVYSRDIGFRCCSEL